MSAEDETAKMATEKFVEEYDNEHKIQPYSGTPKKDGVASAGDASTGFACGDHVHPTDTTRVAVETFNTEISNLRDSVNGKVDALEQGVRGNIVAFGNGSNKLEDTGKTVNDFFDNVAYDENSKKILFKNGDTVLKELSATQFIKDGMVSSVAISNGKLVISFNTDAGKEDIQIPLADIFNPQNYYDKTAADGRFVQKVSGKDIVAVDSALSDSSTNPVQNNVVTEALNDKATAVQGEKADAALSRAEAEAGFTRWTVMRDGEDITDRVAQPRWDNGVGTLDTGWYIRGATLAEDELTASYEDTFAPEDATYIAWNGYQDDQTIVIDYTATRTRLPTMADLNDKADASALRYDIGAETAITSASSEVVEGETVNYGEATLADRTANRVSVTAAIAELRLTFPATDSGKVRDFGLRVEAGDGTAALTAPALVPVAATGEAVTLENPDGAIPALADGAADAKGVTLLYFSETSPGVFLVKGEQVKEA